MDPKQANHAQNWLDGDPALRPEEKLLARQIQALGRADLPDPKFSADLERRLADWAGDPGRLGRVQAGRNLRRGMQRAWQLGVGLAGIALLVGVLVFSMKLLPDNAGLLGAAQPTQTVPAQATPESAAYPPPATSTSQLLAPPADLGGVTLNAAIPAIPGSLAVYHQELWDIPLTEARALQVAARLGVTGEVQAFQSEGGEQSFRVQGDPAEITVRSDQPLVFTYNALSTPFTGAYSYVRPFQERAQTAEEFLNAHGLLEPGDRIIPARGTNWDPFSVVVLQGVGEGVLADTDPRNARILVTFDAEGQVQLVIYERLPLEPVGESRPLSADQVWQGFLGSRIYAQVATIDEIRLAYLAEDFRGISVNAYPADSPLRAVLPMWSFSGTLQDGRAYEALIPAGEDSGGAARMIVEGPP